MNTKIMLQIIGGGIDPEQGEKDSDMAGLNETDHVVRVQYCLALRNHAFFYMILDEGHTAKNARSTVNNIVKQMNYGDFLIISATLSPTIPESSMGILS